MIQYAPSYSQRQWRRKASQPTPSSDTSGTPSKLYVIRASEQIDSGQTTGSATLPVWRPSTAFYYALLIGMIVWLVLSLIVYAILR